MSRYLRTGALAMAGAVLAGTLGAAVVVAQDPVEIDWWHIQTNDPGLSLNQAIADEYMADHPDVKINVTVLENEAFKSKLALELQAGNAPDIFQSWGGGVLAEQAAAGMARPIADEIGDWVDTMNPGAMSIYQVDGVQYGIPYNFGLVGAWYNKDLFAQAGIEQPPATWEEFLTDVQALKDAGITPIALAAGDKWPAMFYWAYLALRAGGQAAMEEAISTGNWDGPAFIEAGNQLKRLIDLQPFQDGFLAAAYNRDEASTMGNGKAAMELMGQWAPGVEAAESESGTGIGDALGWFPFPALDGGAGLPTDVFGGADGYAVGKDAPPEAVDFLRYLSSQAVAERFAATNTGILPATEAAVGAVTDPTLQTLLQKRAEATFAQLYLDQATTPALGSAINDAIQLLFAGQATPEEVSAAITEAAQNQ
jgi:raffinose/stachyose/melibiose transport system substrate-binding protein